MEGIAMSEKEEKHTPEAVAAKVVRALLKVSAKKRRKKRDDIRKQPQHSKAK